jgi:hypothetical protein
MTVALPPSALVFGTGLTQWPGGDRILFEAGGGMLLEIVYRHPLLWQGALKASIWISTLAGILGLAPLTAVMLALAHAGRLSWRELGARALEHFLPFAVLATVTLLAQAALCLVAAAVARGLRVPFTHWAGERNADLALLGWLLFAGLAVLFLGLLEDVARAKVIRSRAGAGPALRSALRLLGTRFGWLAAAYLPRVLWSMALLVAVAFLLPRIAVDQPGSWRVFLAFFVHQTAAFGLLWIRADWLARVLALVAMSRQSADDEESTNG